MSHAEATYNHGSAYARPDARICMHLELDAVPPGANDSEHRSTVANATL